MPARGLVWGYYQSDDGNTYALRTDAAYFPMTERGWTGPAVHGTFVYPRGWSPRRVMGLDDAGHPRFAVVASTSADLWTRVASTFTIYGTDELPHTCTVQRLLRERCSQRP